MASLKWENSPETPTVTQSGSSNNVWFAATMGLLGLIAGFAFAKFQISGLPALANNPQQVAQAPTAQQPTSPPPANSDPADVDDDPMLGEDDAPITLIEFVDYQCPFCSRHFEQTHAQIKKDYIDTGKVKLVMRDFPLSFHPHAQKASEATECADDQGKFWEMHDKLFQTQSTWSSLPDAIRTFKQFAADLGLNTSSFDSCLDGGTYAQEVKGDMAEGTTAGISGTPGFWIIGPDGKGQLISGAYPYNTFKTAFDDLLGSDAQAAAPSGTVKTMKMTAELWKFTPNVVRIKKGENVTLEVTGVSGTHGLAVPALGINETIIQGQTVSIDIPTDKAGTFDFRCSIQCGSGHSDMTGQIVIEG